MREISSICKIGVGATNAKMYSTGIKKFLESRVTWIHSDRLGILSRNNQSTSATVDENDLFIYFNLTDATKKAIELKNLSPDQFKEQCKDLEVFENDYSSSF